MSRFYRMIVEVSDLAADRKDAVKKAAQAEWDLDDWYDDETTMALCGEDSLTGGESEEKFAQRVAKAIWQANGQFCPVEVTATYLENLPCDTYQFDQDDYNRWQVPSTETP